MRDAFELVQILVRVEHQRVRSHVDREHVLDADRDAGAALDRGERLVQPLPVAALPSVRRVGHHRRNTGVGRDLGRSFDLADRVGTPDPAGEQQGRRVDRPDLQPVLGRQLPHHRGVLAGGIPRDHHLDPGVPARRDERERVAEGAREEGGGREQQTGPGHG